MKHNCCTCGKEMECCKPKECWSDNSNALTHPYLGGVECRDCYSKTHTFCPKCVDAPMGKGWLYCPWCGTKVE